MKKRILSLCMALFVTVSTLPTMAFAEGSAQGSGTVVSEGLCEHHTQHGADCGYSEGIPEQPCTHVCSEETGCITKTLDCKHTHDESCGYAPAVAGTPCSFVCEACQGALEQEQCCCSTLCTEGAVNLDCPACSVEGADLTACQGDPPAVPMLLGSARSTVQVSYLDQDGNQKTASATQVTSGETEWTTGWYVVYSDVTIDTERIIVTGDVHLILANGCTLSAKKGITVKNGNNLTIYAQSNNENTMGTLTATSSIANAAIGGSFDQNSVGTVTINGGVVTATGTTGAGIGGGGLGNAGGTVIINGGVVTAISTEGAGIGGGSIGKSGLGTGSGGTVTITGGKVTASSTKGAGIGAGSGGSNQGTLVIAPAQGEKMGAYVGENADSFALLQGFPFTYENKFSGSPTGDHFFTAIAFPMQRLII